MNKVENIRQGIIEHLENKGFHFDIAQSYGEPGYESDKPILLADWNDLSNRRIESIERFFEIEWEDEWIVLHEEDCKAYRTSPDSYGWQPSVAIWQGEFVSFEWLIESGELKEYVENELAGNPKSALNTCKVTKDHLKEFASLLESGFENGLHAGMNDDPAKILEALPEEKRSRVFFRIDSTSQFSLSFEAWELKTEN